MADQALGICGEAHLLTGDIERAAALFTESAGVSAAAPTDAFVVSESELALLAMDRGHWDEAAEHLRVGARSHRCAADARLRDERARLCGRSAAGGAPRRRSQGERSLTQAMRAHPACTFALPGMAVRARLQLAKVYWTNADHTTARHLLREIDDILLHRPDLGVLVDDVSQFRDAVASSAGSGAGGGPPLTPAELRLLPYLQTHLNFREIGERLFVSRNTVSSEVSSIYRKLGVSSRHDAVEHATLIGLIGG